MTGARRTDWQRRRILEAFGTGRELREIAGHFGCKASYPIKLARNAGWPPRPKLFDGVARAMWVARVTRLLEGRSVPVVTVLVAAGIAAVALAASRGPAPARLSAAPVVAAGFGDRWNAPQQFEERWPSPQVIPLMKQARLLDPEPTPVVPIRVRTVSIRAETTEAQAPTGDVAPTPTPRPRAYTRASASLQTHTRDGICAKGKIWIIKRHWKSWRCRR